MKISLISSGNIRDLELKNQKIELSSLRGILELTLGPEETAHIVVNNSEEENLSEGTQRKEMRCANTKHFGWTSCICSVYALSAVWRED